MNTTLTTDRRHDEHQHEPAPPLQALSPVDRVALHLGVALIRWSERPRTPRYRRTYSHEDVQRARQGVERDRTRCAEHGVLIMRVR